MVEGCGKRLVYFLTIIFACINKVLTMKFVAPTELKYLWVTPIQISSLLGPSINVHNSTTNDPFTLTTSFINDLADLQWLYFNDFYDDTALVTSYKIKYDLHEDASISDIFYFYQIEMYDILMNDTCSNNTCKLQQSKFKEIKKMYMKIIEVFESSIEHYLLSNDLPSIEFDSKKVSLWSSIHLNGTFHQAHHHDGNVISGILYLRTTPNSGKLVFEDPRGSLPPFGCTHRITPVEGDLILFPSWLVHLVEPTISTAPRISLSFNYGNGRVGFDGVGIASTGDISKGLRTN